MPRRRAGVQCGCVGVTAAVLGSTLLILSSYASTWQGALGQTVWQHFRQHVGNVSTSLAQVAEASFRVNLTSRATDGEVLAEASAGASADVRGVDGSVQAGFADAEKPNKGPMVGADTTTTINSKKTRSTSALSMEAAAAVPNVTLAPLLAATPRARLYTGSEVVPKGHPDDAWYNKSCIPGFGEGRRLRGRALQATRVQARKRYLGFMEHVALYDKGSRLLFCNLPKNGCTELRQLFIRLIGRPEFEYNPVKYGKQQVCVHQNPVVRDWYKVDHQPVESVRQMFSDNTIFKAAFLRDPLDRFISAYSSKIAREPCSYVCSRLGLDSNKPRTVSMTIAALKRRRDYDQNIDWHFRPQAELCELRTLWPCYNFIGEVANISTEIVRLGQSVDEKLHLGLKALVENGWGVDSNLPLFPKKGRDESSKLMMVSHSKVKLTESEIREVKEYYADDYALLDAVRSGSRGSCKVEFYR